MPRPVSTKIEFIEWGANLPAEHVVRFRKEPQPIAGEVIAEVKVSSHPGWKISVTYRAVETQLTLVEIRVRVNGIDELHSRLRSVAPLNSLAGALAPGAVTAIGLRSIPLSAIENACRKRLAREIRQLRKHEVQSLLVTLDTESLEASDFLDLTTADQLYLTTAAKYVDALGKGTSRPLEALAVKLERTPSSVRNLLYMARQRGFLTESPRGKAGGHLTNKAKEYLHGTR